MSAIENLSRLTARELNVLRLLSNEIPRAQIAKDLQLSKITINAYVKNAVGKLEVADYHEAKRVYLQKQAQG